MNLFLSDRMRKKILPIIEEVKDSWMFVFNWNIFLIKIKDFFYCYKIEKDSLSLLFDSTHINKEDKIKMLFFLNSLIKKIIYTDSIYKNWILNNVIAIKNENQELNDLQEDLQISEKYFILYDDVNNIFYLDKKHKNYYFKNKNINDLIKNIIFYSFINSYLVWLNIYFNKESFLKYFWKKFLEQTKIYSFFEIKEKKENIIFTFSKYSFYSFLPYIYKLLIEQIKNNNWLNKKITLNDFINMFKNIILDWYVDLKQIYWFSFKLIKWDMIYSFENFILLFYFILNRDFQEELTRWKIEKTLNRIKILNNLIKNNNKEELKNLKISFEFFTKFNFLPYELFKKKLNSL